MSPVSLRDLVRYFLTLGATGFGGPVALAPLTVLATPLLVRYGGHPRVAGFVRGVTVAVVGVLAGTTYLVGRPVVTDAVGAAILIVTLAAPFALKKVPEQTYVLAGAVVGVALRH